MRKFRFIYVLMAASFFVACAESDDLYENETNPVAKNPYEISIETAMQTLETMFPEMMRTTRVSASEVKTLRRSDLGMTTRAEDEDPQAPVAYIIPLANNGCAIMGADTRKERLYAALESTTLTPDDIARAVQQQQATRSENTTDSEGADGEFEQIDDIKKFASGLIANSILDSIQFPPQDSFPNGNSPIPIVRNGETLKITILNKAPILKTKWHQRSPFNDSLAIIDNKRIPAGCGPIAISQILYFLQRPDSLNNFPIQWNNFPNYTFDRILSTSMYEKSHLSSCILHIRQAIGISPTQSNCNNFQLVGFLNRLGFNNVSDNMIYNENSVIAMLSNDKPIFAYGLRNDNGNQVGHAWVVDGCKIYYLLIGKNDSIIRNDYSFLHCNFGWEGVCDGYYSKFVINPSIGLDDEYIDSNAGDLFGIKGGHYNLYNGMIFYGL